MYKLRTTFNLRHTTETTKKNSAIVSSAFTYRFKIKNDFKNREKKNRIKFKEKNVFKALNILYVLFYKSENQ